MGSNDGNGQTGFELSSGTVHRAQSTGLWVEGGGWGVRGRGVGVIEACKTQQTRNTKSNQIDTRMKKKCLSQDSIGQEECGVWSKELGLLDMCVCVCAGLYNGRAPEAYTQL